MSSYFSCAESAFVAVNRIRLRNAADEGNKNAKTAIGILDRFDHMLTSILVGNNIANLGCASVATILTIRIFQSLYSPDAAMQSNAAAVATAVTTVVVFLCGEMIPKSIANHNSERMTLFLAPSLKAVIVLLTPLTFLFSWVSRVTNRFLHTKEEPTVTEEELSSIIDTIEEEGVIDEDQGDLLQSALEFSKTTVADVLTIRDDIVFVELSMTSREIINLIIKSKHSRLPVCDGSLDHVVGVLVIRDFLKEYIKNDAVNLREIMKPPYFVSLNASIDDLLKEMGHNRFYMAVVRDASGNTAGVVTIEDFLEELVGEIFDEDDEIDETFMKLGGNYFQVDGTCTLGELFHRMKYTPKESCSLSKPLHIWVLEQLGHEPAEKDSFVWHDLTVTVAETDGDRVRKVEIKLETPSLDVSSYNEPTKDEGAVQGGDRA